MNHSVVDVLQAVGLLADALDLIDLDVPPLQEPDGLPLLGYLFRFYFFSFWALDYKFNFFHLPTADNVPTRSYTQPASRVLVQRLNFIVCPPLVIMAVGMDLGASANLLLATVVVVVNGALYFILGLLVGLLWDKFSQRSRQNQGKFHLDS